MIEAPESGPVSMLGLAQETAYVTVTMTVMIDVMRAHSPEQFAELRKRMLPLLKQITANDAPVRRAGSALDLLLMSLEATRVDLNAAE